MSEIEVALEPVITALKADGYETAVGVEGSAVVMQISAGPNACAECLSPPAILEPLISSLLRDGGISEELDLRYPS